MFLKIPDELKVASLSTTHETHVEKSGTLDVIFNTVVVCVVVAGVAAAIFFIKGGP